MALPAATHVADMPPCMQRSLSPSTETWCANYGTSDLQFYHHRNSQNEACPLLQMVCHLLGHVVSALIIIII